MTSSLVGSEMCIRDRGGRVCPAVFFASTHSKLPWALPMAMAQLGSRSVSYTHLTLPTICSV
eukprot:10887868-Prorocentrum_lima.AAC.1